MIVLALLLGSGIISVSLHAEDVAGLLVDELRPKPTSIATEEAGQAASHAVHPPVAPHVTAPHITLKPDAATGDTLAKAQQELDAASANVNRLLDQGADFSSQDFRNASNAKKAAQQNLDNLKANSGTAVTEPLSLSEKRTNLLNAQRELAVAKQTADVSDIKVITKAEEKVTAAQFYDPTLKTEVRPTPTPIEFTVKPTKPAAVVDETAAQLANDKLAAVRKSTQNILEASDSPTALKKALDAQASTEQKLLSAKVDAQTAGGNARKLEIHDQISEDIEQESEKELVPLLTQKADVEKKLAGLEDQLKDKKLAKQRQSIRDNIKKQNDALNENAKLLAEKQQALEVKMQQKANSALQSNAVLEARTELDRLTSRQTDIQNDILSKQEALTDLEKQLADPALAAKHQDISGKIDVLKENVVSQQKLLSNNRELITSQEKELSYARIESKLLADTKISSLTAEADVMEMRLGQDSKDLEDLMSQSKSKDIANLDKNPAKRNEEIQALQKSVKKQELDLANKRIELANERVKQLRLELVKNSQFTAKSVSEKISAGDQALSNAQKAVQEAKAELAQAQKNPAGNWWKTRTNAQKAAIGSAAAVGLVGAGAGVAAVVIKK